MIEAVVFDLDGTLADTAELDTLHGHRRVPYDVLRLHPPGRPEDWPWVEQTTLSLSGGHNRLPGELITRGYRVAIISRAPDAYVSTLVGLLGLDAQSLTASSSRKSVREKLEELAQFHYASLDEVLYVGDTTDDKEQAEAAGVHFMPADPNLPELLLQKLPNKFPDGPWWRTSDGPGTFQMHLECGKCLYVLPGNLGMPPTHCPKCGCGRELSELIRFGDFADESTPSSVSKSLRRTRSALPLRFNDLVALETSQDPDRTAAVAAHSLLERPSWHRARLQALVFRNLPRAARDCLLAYDDHGVFGFDPRLVTQAELTEGRRFEAARAAARLFPALKRENWQPQMDETPLYEVISVWPYHIRPWGHDLWWKVKHWHGMRSGQEVHQSYLRFMALVLAGHILEDSMEGTIVPVPPSPMTPDKPGECSLRLASLIGEYLPTRFTVEHALRKTDNRQIGCVPNSDILDGHATDRNVILVDDQITRGRAIAQSANALAESGVHVRHVVTWSSSYEIAHPDVPSEQLTCWMGHFPSHDGDYLSECAQHGYGESGRPPEERPDEYTPKPEHRFMSDEEPF